MSKKILILLAVLITSFVIASRLKYKFPYLYSWDSVQFALSIENYDIIKHQPHPPGYILYSAILKIVDYFVKDPNLTMIIINIAFTVIGCLFLFLLVSNLLHNLEPITKALLSIGAAAIYATNPINWFYGSIAEIYALEGGIVPILSYLCVLSVKKPRILILTSIVLALVGGIRLTTELFFLPVYFYILLKTDRKTATRSSLIILITNLLWLIPTATFSEGIENYLTVLSDQARRESNRTAGFNSEIAVDIVISMIQGITIPILVLLLLKIRKLRLDLNQKVLIMTITPALTFFLFVHYAKHGYLLFVIPLVLAFSISLMKDAVKSYTVLFFVFFISITTNILVFVNPPIFKTDEVAADVLKRIVFKITFPNSHTQNVEKERLKLFFAKIAELGIRKKAFIVQNGSWPDWRTIMYYYPTDTSVLLLQKKRALIAESHLVRNVRQPLYLTGDERLIITIGKKPNNPQFRPFKVDVFTHYYGYAGHFPNGFRVYEFQFFKRKNPGTKNGPHP